MASFSALNALLCVMGAGSEHCLTATSKQHGVPPLPPQPVWGKTADEAGTGCGARPTAWGAHVRAVGCVREIQPQSWVLRRAEALSAPGRFKAAGELFRGRSKRSSA